MMQDTNHDSMQQLVTEIAKALVDDPQAVEVQAVARDENTVLRLRVASADAQFVLFGANGETFHPPFNNQGINAMVPFIRMCLGNNQIN